MTREERDKAIDLLDNLIGMVEDNQYNDYDFALKKGIESLRKEPCEDAISRRAVLAGIKNLYPDMPIVNIMDARRKWLEKYAPYFECEKVVEHLPSVTPSEWEQDHKLLKACGDAVDIVLYKIKAEIEQRYCKVINDYDKGRNYGLYIATQIIDSYKGK